MKKKRQWTYIIPMVTIDYWRLVMVDMADLPAGLYGLENRRAALHAELCEYYGLTKEQTQEVTDYMDRLRIHDGGCSCALHHALQDLWETYPLPADPPEAEGDANDE